jgi:O-antigen ligase
MHCRIADSSIEPGVRGERGEARRVIPDPLTLLAYAVFFTVVTLLTLRRPAYGLCALMLTWPFAFYQVLPGTMVTLPKTALLAVLLGLLARPQPFAVLGGNAARRIWIAGLLVTAATALSIVQATYRGVAIRETLKIAEYVVLFCVSAAAYRLDPDRELVRATVFVTAFLVCAAALSQEIAGAHSILLLGGHPVPRIAGPLEGPNQLAGYFDTLLPLTLVLAIDRPSREASAALFVIVLTDVLTFSRGGTIGAIAAVAVVAISMPSGRRMLLPVAAGAAAGLAGILGWGAAAQTFGLSRFWELDPSTYAGGVGTRPELWRAALTLWRRHPLLGIGAGNFQYEIGLAGIRGVRTQAPSLYLQSLVEGGISLLAATIYLLGVSIFTFARERLRSPFVLAAFAATVALALHQTVDLLTFYPKVGGEWWMVMGLGAAELCAVHACAF